MSDSWSQGYQTGVGYTHGYYKELSPTLQRFATLLLGYDILPASDDDVHMELGFGQGISINIHAASQRGKYIGNDFNPSHAFHAQQLSQAAGSHADLSDLSFAEMAARTDLPSCNSISLHGIWSWINDENRQHIIAIIKRCLKPGGVVYNSYNSINGHAGFMPWREMMYEYYLQQIGSPLQRIEATIAHFNQVFESNPNILNHSSTFKSSWERVRTAGRDYLLHEYFNANWDCFSLSQVVEQLSAAKVSFIGSTACNAYINQISLEPAIFNQVNAQTNIVESEQWRDILIQNTFRQDLFIKGERQLSQQEMLKRLLPYAFMPTVDNNQFGNFLFAADAPPRFNDDLFEPIKKELFADDYAPKTLAQLLKAVDSKYSWTHLIQVILLKIRTGQLQPCLETTAGEEQIKHCHGLNRALLQSLDSKLAGLHLASPVTGMGVHLDFSSAWCLKEFWQNPNVSDAEIAENIWACLESHQRVMIDHQGNNIYGKEANVAWLKAQLPTIRARLPLWRALGLFA